MKRSIEENFWAKVQKTETCWLWTGARRGRQPKYGSAWNGSRVVGAHIYSYELQHGPVPEGLCVLHNCPEGDNSLCVNPAHLWVGTRTDNNRDRDTKGRTASGDASGARQKPDRWRKGESHRDAKLTAKAVLEIRALHAAGPVNQSALARQYGVSSQSIHSAIHRITWKHIK